MGIERVPVGVNPPGEVYVVVEIEHGGVNKYEWDATLGVMRLDRALLSAVHYPADYGFIPRTLAADGDTVDALVLTNEATFPGCVIPARPVALLRMRDEHGGDDKVLCVPTVDPRYDHLRDLGDVSPHLLREIEHFFTVYKDLEQREVQTFGWESRDAALELIRGAIAAHDQAQDPGQDPAQDPAQDGAHRR